MKATVNVKKDVELKTLHVEAGVRYWEDATVNDVEDEIGNLIPCREGDVWKPIIEIDTGKILNWKQGVKADIHYKVCDDGSYYLKDENGETVLSIENDYVPRMLCPEENGYGDYIIMHVNEEGIIKSWKPSLSGFTKEED